MGADPIIFYQKHWLNFDLYKIGVTDASLSVFRGYQYLIPLEKASESSREGEQKSSPYRAGDQPALSLEYLIRLSLMLSCHT